MDGSVNHRDIDNDTALEQQSPSEAPLELPYRHARWIRQVCTVGAQRLADIAWDNPRVKGLFDKTIYSDKAFFNGESSKAVLSVRAYTLNLFIVASLLRDGVHRGNSYWDKVFNAFKVAVESEREALAQKVVTTFGAILGPEEALQSSGLRNDPFEPYYGSFSPNTQLSPYEIFAREIASEATSRTGKEIQDTVDYLTYLAEFLAPKIVEFAESVPESFEH